MAMAEGSKKSSKKPSAPPLPSAPVLSPKNPFLSAALAELDALGDSDDESEAGNSVFAFPVIRPPPVQGVAQAPYYEGIGIEDIGRLKKAVSLYGPQSHYVKELVNGLARHYNNFSPEDWRVLCRALLKEPKYLQWQMWFSELCMDRTRQNALNPNPRIQAITYQMLAGIGQYSDIAAQVNTPEEIHEQLREIGLEAWERIRPTGEHYGSRTKVIQKTNEPYVEFLSRLKLTLERTVIGEEARQQLLKLLAYENANEDCKRVILPIKDTGDINTFMKACKDVTSESRKMQLFAETMATTWHSLQSKQLDNMKCFGCGQLGHLKRNCRGKNQICFLDSD
ncbi:endogenous retrovirus group K member 8 Gag polyprotein-like [Zalophus californianus]|uniref:Endogenous retrovirus group K member 8 Gag polyprotein-like n=1 Tax=Zalophus californianus TaxID=9704 RepID=A0A6J2D4G3_ZALCA|nr:endogenous retrovirus group K member 8 Gag polyprotein-like [Zalophus californianus]